MHEFNSIFLGDCHIWIKKDCQQSRTHENHFSRFAWKLFMVGDSLGYNKWNNSQANCMFVFVCILKKKKKSKRIEPPVIRSCVVFLNDTCYFVCIIFFKHMTWYLKLPLYFSLFLFDSIFLASLSRCNVAHVCMDPDRSMTNIYTWCVFIFIVFFIFFSLYFFSVWARST